MLDEADPKRWHLTHQHPDLKDLFQAEAARDGAKRSKHARSADAFEELKKKHANLQEHCRSVEARLQISRQPCNCSRWNVRHWPTEALKLQRSAHASPPHAMKRPVVVILSSVARCGGRSVFRILFYLAS
ncbi:hypothetical protein [Streptomyces sp. CA-106131]|uniref:hypothetical protein n=1 Tax=Streptomyces sp. CA-106131 TaxID=3240045 RepID=UPI003D8D5509